MGPGELRVLGDGRAATWVSRRLAAAGSRTVGCLVPSGFAGYVRLLHPVHGPGGPASWAEVAAGHGRVLTALTPWSAIADAAVGEPTAGSLPPEQLAALCDVLAEHTGAAQECVFALGEAWPGWHLAGLADVAPPDPPRVSIGGREHVLVGGPLTAAVPLSFSDAPGHWWAQSPTFFWPADRAWCVATAPDRQCTLVGGSIALVEDLAAAPGLEVWAVRTDDPMPAAG